MSVTVGHTAAGARKSEAVSGFNSTPRRSWGGICDPGDNGSRLQ